LVQRWWRTLLIEDLAYPKYFFDLLFFDAVDDALDTDVGDRLLQVKFL
jgi:hypothetical protein